MTTGERQITEWAGQCRAGQLSRRDFGQRLLRMTGSVPVVLAVMHGLGIAVDAHEVVDPRQHDILRCSFCNKDKDQVTRLIAGPAVFICDECIDICNEIIADDKLPAAERGATGR